MGLIKSLAIGAAVAYGINYITKKGTDGRSVFDDISDKAPQWMNKAKEFGEQAINQVSQKVTTASSPSASQNL